MTNPEYWKNGKIVKTFHIDSQLWHRFFFTVPAWDYASHLLWAISGSAKKELKYFFQGIKRYRQRHFRTQNVNISLLQVFISNIKIQKPFQTAQQLDRNIFL